MGTRLLTATLEDRHGIPFAVRPYTTADRTALEHMYASFLPKRCAQGLPPEEPGISRWLDRVLAGGLHMLVLVDGTLVGHVMLIPMEDGRVELANFLHQGVRNRGIGTALNRHALAVAAEAGSPAVWLSVEPSNRVAIRSYESAGFARMPGSLWAPEIEMQAHTAPLAGPLTVA